MTKDAAKGLLSDIYNEVEQHIDKLDDEVDEIEIIDFLHDIANSLFKNDFKYPFDFYSQQITFEEDYKLVAKQSLSSYSDSHEKFTELTKAQQIVLEKISTNKGRPEELSKRFKKIHTHLNEELLKANALINQLINRVSILEDKASIDPLTKVHNRRALDTHLEAMAALDEHEHQIMMHILMLDVDDFKRINDTYGHLIGDKVLILLANILKNTLREGDKVFRYGGEEFVIILNRITQEGCDLVCARILDLVRSDRLTIKDEEIKVTLSIGATMFKYDDTPESALQRADQALYLAKNAGKDQVKVNN